MENAHDAPTATYKKSRMRPIDAVYKAFDLILNQIVALKFLAADHFSEAALVRFAENLHFLAMEYIDGEDLASLLRYMRCRNRSILRFSPS